MANPIRVLIADDSAEFRKSIHAILTFEPDIKVVALARDGAEAVEMAREHQPDVALMDILMPKVDGITAIHAIAEVSPDTVCMVMSSEGEQDMLRKAMAAGVREYLVKPFSATEFVAAIQRVKVYAEAAKERTTATLTIKSERDNYLSQLTMAYLRLGRMDDEASHVYAELLLVSPQIDLKLLVRLAEVFVARRDWQTLRQICRRMEKGTAPLEVSPAVPETKLNDDQLNQLVHEYVRLWRLDDEAARAYAILIERPAADLAVMERLGDAFFARRDWRQLRALCERLSPQPPEITATDPFPTL